ncbi:hypothetical protein DFP73DRAFT_586035 [Morchella snyderi]|nr:hypothetical protein DFP73DRAFT_586035 [Morchella snyderi]
MLCMTFVSSTEDDKSTLQGRERESVHGRIRELFQQLESRKASVQKAQCPSRPTPHRSESSPPGTIRRSITASHSASHEPTNTSPPPPTPTRLSTPPPLLSSPAHTHTPVKPAHRYKTHSPDMFHPQRTRTRYPRNRRPRSRSLHAPHPSPAVVPTNTFTRPDAHGGTLWVPARPPRPDQHSRQSPRPNERPPPHPEFSRLNERPQLPHTAPNDNGRLSRSSSTTRPPPRIEAPLPVPQVRAQPRPRSKRLEKSVVVGVRVERMTSVLAAWDKRWDAACALPTPPEKEEEEEEEEEQEEGGASALPATITSTVTTAKDKSQPLDENAEDDDKAEALPSSSVGGVALPRSMVDGLYCPRSTREMQVQQLRAKIPWLVRQGTLGGAGWRPLEEYYWDEGRSGAGC